MVTGWGVEDPLVNVTAFDGDVNLLIVLTSRSTPCVAVPAETFKVAVAVPVGALFTVT